MIVTAKAERSVVSSEVTYSVFCCIKLKNMAECKNALYPS